MVHKRKFKKIKKKNEKKFKKKIPKKVQKRDYRGLHISGHTCNRPDLS